MTRDAVCEKAQEDAIQTGARIVGEMLFGIVQALKPTRQEGGLVLVEFDEDQLRQVILAGLAEVTKSLREECDLVVKQLDATAQTGKLDREGFTDAVARFFSVLMTWGQIPDQPQG